MTFQIRQAERRKARLRLALIGPSGSGKTLSALLVAYGVVGAWESVALIDTEQGSGELYEGETIAGTTIGRYRYGRITAPFTVEKYLDAIHACEAAVGLEGVVIIDSLSHAWAAEGGLLDTVDRLTERGNKWAAWRHVTPQHNALVEAMLQSPSHIVACVRAKQDYVQEKDEHGKTVVRKVGLAPVQRDGLEFEFTTVLDLDMGHQAGASKDRTRVMDGRLVKPSVALGREFKTWLERGVDGVAPSTPTSATPEAAKAAPRNGPLGALWQAYRDLTGEPAGSKETEAEKARRLTRTKACGYDVDSWTRLTPLQVDDLYSKFKRQLDDKREAAGANGKDSATPAPSRPSASEAQRRAIRSLGRVKGLEGAALDGFLQQRFRAGLDGLDMDQASHAIKALQGA
jgi:hypothetical protein